MIYKKNWLLMKKFLEYRLSVDQISQGSFRVEKTYMRYILEWAQEHPFQKIMTKRPTLPEYLLSARLNGTEKPLSPGYIKKTLATARLFFSWLTDNEPGYKRIKIAWIKTLKAKRLVEVPKTKDAVSLEEVLRMAGTPAESLVDRRARAAVVFLFLSGMRIGAFISLPLQAVDIPNRTVIQDPRLGVKTKNRKYGKTTLLEIPELLKVAQEWDNEIRSVLSPNGFWFAPFSPDTGQIDMGANSIGEHRINLARRNIKIWLEKVKLPYHSPHKFRHDHIQYAMSLAKSITDYKAVSMNVMHSSMEITDEFYSNLNDDDIQIRISSLGKDIRQENNDQNDISLIKEFLIWRENKRSE